MSDKVHTAVPVHDKSMKVIRAFDTLDVRCHYCCCTYVRCRRVLCVAITCPHQELWCRPLAHCCICTDTAPLMSMPHIARKGVTMRTYNALWVNLFLSARTLIDKKQGKTSVCAINVARPKLTKKIPPKELNWTNFTKNGAELPRWANNLDRTSLQVHSRLSSPYDWSTRSELYPEAETAQPGQRVTTRCTHTERAHTRSATETLSGKQW